MKILLAPDSFKECLSATEVCTAMCRGILERFPRASVVSAPMADGGEGTVESIRRALPLEDVSLTVAGPMQDRVDAVYGLDPRSGTAVIESAGACGLARVAPEARDPLVATTRGVGEMVRDALDRGAKRILLALGGVATVDGGTGLAGALGFAFLDREKRPLAGGGGALSDLACIETPPHRPWEGVEIEALCDVTNPLVGDRGAARTYGPQKGATPAQVEVLETGLCRLAEVMARSLGPRIAEAPGAGAAGGLGFGLAGFLGAKLVPGASRIMDLVGLEGAMAGADLVITGEGRTDSQTAHGKVCSHVASLAAEGGIPCVILSGAVKGSTDALLDLGATAVFSISPGPEALETAIRRAPERLARAAGNIAGLLAAGRGRRG